MRRTVVGLGAALVATALIFGPGRSLLTGPARVELPAASMTQPSQAQGARADASPAPAAAAVVATPAVNAARVSLAVRPAEKAAQGYVLSVRLAAPDGKPVNEATVRFHEVVELFGQREMYIGASSTDGQGNAALSYLPARLGSHEIVARSSAKDRVAGSETRTTFEATVAAPAYRPARAPLAAFSAALPYAVGAVVLAVWALLAFALFGTARGVLGGARDPAQKKGDIA